MDGPFGRKYPQIVSSKDRAKYYFKNERTLLDLDFPWQILSLHGQILTLQPPDSEPPDSK